MVNNIEKLINDLNFFVNYINSTCIIDSSQVAWPSKVVIEEKFAQGHTQWFSCVATGKVDYKVTAFLLYYLSR